MDDLKKPDKNEIAEKEEMNKKAKIAELCLLPQLLPNKLGNALLLQFIVNSNTGEQSDKLGILVLGFAIGISSLAITLHSATMGFIFKSFTVLFNFKPQRVRNVRKLAHWINNFLCLSQVIMVNVLFLMCMYYNDKVVYEKNAEGAENYFVKKQIFMLCEVVSTMVFGCTLIAAVAVIFLYCLHSRFKKTAMATKV